MRCHRLHLILVLMLLLFSELSYGQAWSGILSASRAIDWSNAGLPTILPDGEKTANPWTPPARTTICQTLGVAGQSSTYLQSVTAAQINSAISACPAGQAVLLNSGTYTISSGINLYGHNNVTLRGSGASNTILSLTGGNVTIGNYGAWPLNWAQLTSASSNYTLNNNQIAVTAGAGGAPPLGMATLGQCNSGTSAPSGAFMGYENWNPSANGNVFCNIGTQSDTAPHSLYVCGHSGGYTGGAGNCNEDSRIGSDFQSEEQVIYITNVTGAGTAGNPWIVTFTPGMYMQNWEYARTAALAWPTQSQVAVGMGLEDVTLYIAISGQELFIEGGYASWVKGVRIIQPYANEAVRMFSSAHSLFANNYVMGTFLGGGTVYLFTQSLPGYAQGNADDLFINNILSGSLWDGGGSSEGNVYAYNYHVIDETGQLLDEYDHDWGTSFFLREGNVFGSSFDDNTWGTHNLDTWFRNYILGNSAPYNLGGNNTLVVDNFSRFDNAIGNVLGSSQTSTYEASGCCGEVFRVSSSPDAITYNSFMRWGNYSVCTNDGKHCNKVCWNNCGTVDVPTSIAGTDGTFNNAVPSTQNLPASFFMPNTAGSPPSWWKVCTNWSSFPTSCATSQTQPFPPIGPDVSASPVNTFLVPNAASHATEIPAVLAWETLPIDTAYQVPFSVTLSQWSGGIETLSGISFSAADHLMGGFTFTSSNSACFPAGMASGGELLMTSSSSTSVSYALATNPGSCTGTVKWPDVRQFDERVYGSASVVSGSVSPPTGLTALVE